MRIGLIVNPIAGLGGRVGLKGTDGADTVTEALARGAIAQAGLRTRRALTHLAQRNPDTQITCAPSALGADWAQVTNLDFDVLDLPTATGTARDTCTAVHAMHDCDLIVFAGGDGTALNVSSALAPGQAMLGIPCGVKMHSGVFAITPESAGALMAEMVSAPDRINWNDQAEIMDIDEAALRQGHIAPTLYGHARVPYLRNRMQAAKGGPRISSAAALTSAAMDIVAHMLPDTLYVIGPGTSAGAIMSAAGHTPTILGIDAMRNGIVVGRDLTMAELDRLARDSPIKIVLGVTGRQGFLIGRGNQQISPETLAKAGRDGLIVLASQDKIAHLAQPVLWIDSGAPNLDAQFGGFIRVQTGRGRETMMRISAG